jgi:hypothetical protein
MISLTVVIVTMAIILGGLWMLLKFNQGEELRKDYRDKNQDMRHPHGRKRGAH